MRANAEMRSPRHIVTAHKVLDCCSQNDLVANPAEERRVFMEWLVAAFGKTEGGNHRSAANAFRQLAAGRQTSHGNDAFRKEEFIGLLTENSYPHNPRKAFAVLDVDGNGLVTSHDIEKIQMRMDAAKRLTDTHPYCNTFCWVVRPGGLAEI